MTPRSPRHNYSRKKALAGFLILLVLAIVVLAGGWYAYNRLTQQVDITAVNWQYSSCWPDGSSGGVGGLSFGTTYVVTASLTAPYYATCAITGVSISTNGFSVHNSNAPLTVNPGSTQTLSITLGLPDSSYTGAVTVDVQVTEN
jgi:hypothetical protein